MDGDLQKYLERSAAAIEETLAETSPSAPQKPAKKASLSQAKRPQSYSRSARTILLGFLDFQPLFPAPLASSGKTPVRKLLSPIKSPN